jgi:hypothetical protein
MPFQCKDKEWVFPWENEAKQGHLFIASISTSSVWRYWTRVLRAVELDGVLVIRYHNRPIGVVGAPFILYSLLQEQRAGQDNDQYRAIKVGVEKALRFVTAAPVKPTLSTRRIEVSAKPKSIAALLREVDATVVTYRQRRLRAFLLALPALARAWTEPTQTDQLLAWMHKVFEAIYDEPMVAW